MLINSNAVLGMPLFFMSLCFGMAHCFVLLRQVGKWAQKPAVVNREVLLPPPTKQYHRVASRSFFFSLCASWMAIFVLLLAGFSASILLPNSWLNWTSHKIRVNAIEIVDHESAFRDFKFGFVTRPEVPEAFFLTLQIHLGKQVIGKIFPDVYLFYGYLLLTTLALAGLKRQVRFWGVVFLTGLFSVCYIHCWWYHNWHGWFGGIGEFIFSEPSFFEKLARTLGQVSNVLLGLLCLPIFRHSPFHYVINVSWEKTIALHRGLGNAFLVVSCLHMLCWWKVFDEQEVFPHDALSGVFYSAPTFFPLNMHAKPGKCSGLTCLDPLYQVPAADNFTIPLMNFLTFYIVIPVFGILTFRWFRRHHFEWFYYLHLCGALILVLAVFWHAASVLVFLLPGSLLTCSEAVFRYVNMAKQGTIVEVSEDETLTSLRIQYANFNFVPGQYVLISIPSLSFFAFHPFSVASSTQDSFSVYIHGVGKYDSFSRKVRSAQVGDIIHLQGPYGKPPSIENRDAIILVAGGIGITPIVSMVEQLSLVGNTCPVLILWASRKVHIFQRFEKFIESCRAASFIQLRLFDTGSGSHFRQGRPDIQLEMDCFLQNCPLLNNVLVFACGPHSLVKETRAHSQGFEYFEEYFEL